MYGLKAVWLVHGGENETRKENLSGSIACPFYGGLITPLPLEPPIMCIVIEDMPDVEVLLEESKGIHHAS